VFSDRWELVNCIVYLVRSYRLTNISWSSTSKVPGIDKVLLEHIYVAKFLKEFCTGWVFKAPNLPPMTLKCSRRRRLGSEYVLWSEKSRLGLYQRIFHKFIVLHRCSLTNVCILFQRDQRSSWPKVEFRVVCLIEANAVVAYSTFAGECGHL